MNKEKYLEDLGEIRKIMGESTQFLSLSGISGVLVGIFALLGSAQVYYLIENHVGNYITLESTTFRYIVITAGVVLFLSVVTAFLFTYLKARKSSQQLWNAASKKLIINFLIPLLTGGCFSILLINQQVYGLIGSVTLIFYGLACINASKYTLRDIRYLGLIQVVLGLLSMAVPGYSLYFWALGFGVFHIIYGFIMYFKYDKK